MHMDAREKLVKDERLSDVIDTAGLKPADDLRRLGEPGHEDNRNACKLRQALHSPACLEPVELWHDGVQENEVRRDLLDQRECAVAGDGD